MSLRGLFPPEVEVVTATAEMWRTPVLPAEEALISNALEKRRQEFRAGRHCAHQALINLDRRVEPVLRDEKRAPVWPSGILGSITHCRDFCLAACCHEGEIIGLGVDVEPLAPLKSGVARHVHTAEEDAFMHAHPELPERLIFSAKESLYKAYYPVLQRYFGFQSVQLNLDIRQQSFEFRPTKDAMVTFPAGLRFHGRFLTTNSHLLASSYLMR